MAEQPQPLDAIPLIRRKRAGEDAEPTVAPLPPSSTSAPEPQISSSASNSPLRMKAREAVQLAAVHVRIPEQIARGLRLMSVLEGRQAQELAAEAFENMLDAWNPDWRQSVPPRS